MVAAVRAGWYGLARQIQTEDSSLLRGCIEGFGPLDKAVLFKLFDDIVGLALAHSSGGRELRHGSQAAVGAGRVGHVIECLQNVHLALGQEGAPLTENAFKSV